MRRSERQGGTGWVQVLRAGVPGGTGGSGSGSGPESSGQIANQQDCGSAEGHGV